jgi:hypothetical protein
LGSKPSPTKKKKKKKKPSMKVHAAISAMWEVEMEDENLGLRLTPDKKDKTLPKKWKQ